MMVRCKNIVIICTIFFGLFLLKSIIFSPEEDHMKQWDNVLLKGGSPALTKLKTEFKSKGLLINTTGCQIELIEPFDERFPEIKDRFETHQPVDCGAEISPLTRLQDGILTFDVKARNKHYPEVDKCSYKAFFSDNNDNKNIKYGSEIPLDIDGRNEIKDEFILVSCVNQQGEVIFRNINQQIVEKPQSDGSPFPDRNPDELNVLGFTFESVSRLMFLRHCPEIHKYITETLGGVMFNGYNKLGDNTSPNLYPLLTGKHLFDDWKNLLLTPLDDMDWIFKEYERNGYATLLFEEATEWKMPSWVKWFHRDPTTHYHRPVRIQWNSVKPVPEVNNKVCYGTTHRFTSTLDWIREFTLKYKEKKTMTLASLVWSIDTHNRLNGISGVKDVLFNFLKQMERDGTLNSTVVFLASDHGMRVGEKKNNQLYISTDAGAYEARLPFAYMIVPKWFQDKYKDAYRNMKENARNRLVSPFDAWRTLKAVLNKEYVTDPQSQKVDKNQFGISLFSPIPEVRDCTGAGISDHWCSCGRFEQIASNDPRAIKAGEILIELTNRMIRDSNFSKCLLFKDFEVTDAKLILPSKDIRITIKTLPIPADLRSTIKLSSENNVIVTNIERLDLYARYTKCLEKESHTSKYQVLPMTCICKDAVNL